MRSVNNNLTILLLLAFLGIFCIGLPVNALAKQPTPQSGTVLRVSDGDTIRVRVDKEEIKVRLYGIDAPESKQPGGREATEFLKDLLLSENVTLYTFDVDRYGREVAIVVLPDGSIVQDQLLKAGLVWVYTKYCKVDKCKDWKRLEKQAKANQAGLWMDDSAVPPWEWRKQSTTTD